MKTVLTLDPVRIAAFRHVRRSRRMPVKGSFFALDRCWDCKKIATSVRVLGPVSKIQIVSPWNGQTYTIDLEPTRRVENVVRVELQNVGRIYADGRVKLPRRATAPVTQYLVKYVGADRYTPVRETGGKYEHVEPAV